MIEITFRVAVLNGPSTSGFRGRSKAYIDLRVQGGYADPDLVVMHPNTLGALRRIKDDQGRYLLELLSCPMNLTADGSPMVGIHTEPNNHSIVPQGSPANAGTLWGAPIAITTQCPAGTAIVASIQAGAGIFWQRLGMRIEFNMWSDSEWTNNLYSFRCEERVALSVPRAEALNILTGLPTS